MQIQKVESILLRINLLSQKDNYLVIMINQKNHGVRIKQESTSIWTIISYFYYFQLMNMKLSSNVPQTVNYSSSPKQTFKSNLTRACHD